MGVAARIIVRAARWGRQSCLQAGILLGALWCAGVPAAWAQVVLLVEGNASIYRQAAQGFQQGFSNPVSLERIELSGDSPERETRLAALRKNQPRLVVAIGTQVARAAKSQLAGVPLLYCLALSPEENDLVGPDIGGIGFDVKLSEQFAVIQKALPKIKRIGVIYDEPVSGRLVREARQHLQPGVRLEAREARSPQEAARAIQTLSGQVDAFWLLWDRVIANQANFRLLVDFSLKNKVALIAPAAPFVEAGALLSVGADYGKAGRRAAELAKLILEGKARAGDFPAEPPQDPVLTINGGVARLLNLSFPPDLRADILAPP